MPVRIAAIGAGIMGWDAAYAIVRDAPGAAQWVVTAQSAARAAAEACLARQRMAEQSRQIGVRRSGILPNTMEWLNKPMALPPTMRRGQCREGNG